MTAVVPTSHEHPVQTTTSSAASDDPSRWAFEVTPCDRTPVLRPTERAALEEIAHRHQVSTTPRGWPVWIRTDLQRLLQPVDEILAHTGAARTSRVLVRCTLVRAMLERETTYWAWSADEWRAVIERTRQREGTHHLQHLLVIAYVLAKMTRLPLEIPGTKRTELAAKLFGGAAVAAATDRLRVELHRWGLRRRADRA
jgi:hypothetical protein